MPLYEKISDIIKSFQALENMSRSKEFTGSVPLNLIEMIDQGKNPDDYARKLVSEVQNIQEKVAKKQLWMKHLKDSLDPLVALNFPDAASYE
ncbi:hypothetical protein TRFO_28299 [Tritrichomonas foetus]|uniref:Mediator of RNA polymerase II transcription subunit 10 n=1 Tax=Tritrichomonas foetus TaxID=1144522 RepID=A0A1J4JYL5_9EUKA|nr:hypothetical protein TRFO_28299 [Tritrichomonas foetus]|eukprot:OHT04249.1 hypothetical protein TRFO_28299 [Tritrichomonas foetus]